jgi:hypothetical protein
MDAPPHLTFPLNTLWYIRPQHTASIYGCSMYLICVLKTIMNFRYLFRKGEHLCISLHRMVTLISVVYWYTMAAIQTIRIKYVVYTDYLVIRSFSVKFWGPLKLDILIAHCPDPFNVFVNYLVVEVRFDVRTIRLRYIYFIFIQYTVKLL